ncbi:hypothetical protein ACJMK2_027334 [Sinanodonta woodiana]|uniref:Retrotransposon gag domain-containing protein n=1 Tax=Sinanodonta woodiana TaxID=1069815 RepID=A0ABD3XQQ4_SINWO
MKKGVTPHNYNLRSRLGTELLRPSDFTPPTHVSTPKATAPQPSNDLPVTPTTSILLDAATPVTIYPPLTSPSTTPTYATSIIATPSTAPIILPLTDSDSTTSPLSQSQPTPFQHSVQHQFSLGSCNNVPVTNTINLQNSVSETKILKEHFSRNSYNSGFIQPGMSSSIKLEIFQGDQTQNPVTWLEHFMNWAKFYELSEPKILNAFPFHLQGHAKIWYDTLSDNEKNDWCTLVTAFKSRFHNDDVILDLSILQTQQGSSESVLDYLSRLLRLATNKPISDQVLLAVALNGLKPTVKRIVMNKNPTNMTDLRQAAVLAEKSIATTDTTDLLAFNTILDEVKQLKDEVKVANSMQQQYIHAYSQPPTNGNHITQAFQPRNFPQRGSYYTQHSNSTVHSQTFTPRTHGSTNSPVKGTRYQQQPQNRTPNSCFFCGGSCISRSVCRARNVQCHFCHKLGHFSRVCMSTQKR